MKGGKERRGGILRDTRWSRGSGRGGGVGGGKESEGGAEGSERAGVGFGVGYGGRGTEAGGGQGEGSTRRLNVELRRAVVPGRAGAVAASAMGAGRGAEGRGRAAGWLEALHDGGVTLPEELVPHKVQRTDVAEADGDANQMAVLWEAEVVPGEYGCWLCRSCCMLEQLFPTAGVGCLGERSQLEELVAGQWYRCDLAEHEVTEARLQATFREEMLDACLARWRLLETLRRSYVGSGVVPSPEALDTVVTDAFARSTADAAWRRKRRRGKRGTAGRMNGQVGARSKSTREGKEDEEGEELEREEEAQRSRFVSLATSAIPPYPVGAHRTIDIPDRNQQQREHYGVTATLLLDGDVIFVHR
eukprot:Sspe_Gene.10626::Locus_3557_Transcript_1_1_Confidence_1.000_Length_1158::g.10626::m.10626